MEYVDRSYSKDEVMDLMDPLISRWFNGRFTGLTEPQSKAIPLIHERRNVLVSSPTGSGKTLTAFLSIINELTRYAKEGTLEERVYCIYVSPLKALANDVNRNLESPLREMRELAAAEGEEFPDIRVAVRSGDTSQYERQKMVRKPPHILITTPESLALILAAPKFRERFDRVEWVILDEIHDICDSKRGVFLSLTLERLQHFCRERFTRLGLSATLAPIEDIAGYLVGCDEGELREVSVVEVRSRRDLDLQVVCPTEDMTALPFEIVNAKMYDMLKELIDGHETTLVFTNTRSGTESVVYKLKERGLESVEAHHGSLGKDIRLDVEERLKRGELKCVVSSTSLELGIDIGSVDLVCQIGSPKSVAKGLQRIGRSGHSVGKVPKGRLIVFEQDDLVECAVLSRAAHRNDIDRVAIPEDCLDVLSQSVVGMSLESRWEVEEAFQLVRRSYCYRDLDRESFLSVLRYLGSKDAFENVYSKIWYDEEEARFGKKKGARMIYFLNLGTIPEEANYRVYTNRGGTVGELSEKFVERLAPRDIFVLGGRSYEFVRAKGMRAFVKEASGKKPTVPSWTGEMLPRSFDLSMDIAAFRGEMEERLDDDDAEVIGWLTTDFDIDSGSARSILSYFREQREVSGFVPDDRELVVEEYVDVSQNHNLVFHFPFGRRVNDALSRAYAHRVSSMLGCNVTVSISDDTFMLNVPKRVDLSTIPGLLGSDKLEGVLRRAVKDSELFKQRFRHTAARSFMILRNYKGRQVSVNRQQVRSSYLLDSLTRMEGVPVIEETYREVMEDVMDVQNAREVLRAVEEGRMRVTTVPFTGTPSPFAHNAILSGISDIVLMEDRSALLRELHRKVLTKALGSDIREFEFQEDEVVPYFREKIGRASGKEGLLRLLERAGPLRVFKERGRNVHPYCDDDVRTVEGWARELLEEGRVATAFLDDVHLIPATELPFYASALRRERELGDLDRRVLEAMGGKVSSRELEEALEVSQDRVYRSLRKLESMYLVTRVSMPRGQWRYARLEMELPPRQEALDHVVRRHLACFAPATVEEVAFALSMPEEDARRTLEDLVREEEVDKGRFLVAEHTQYMLRRDHLRLRSDSLQVYDHREIEAYRRSKQGDFASIRECLSFFGEMGVTLDLFNRVKGFDLEEWHGMRERGEVLLGRFLRGKVRFVLAEDAPMYASAYREVALSRLDRTVLSTLERHGGLSMRQLSAQLDLPKEDLKASIDRLDRNAYVVRRFEEREDWSSENVYLPLHCDAYEGDARGAIVERFLRTFGPVPLYSIRAYTGFSVEEIREALHGLGPETILVGEGQVQMYVLPEEVPLLEAHRKVEGETRIVSLYDPEVQPLWAEVASKYGDRWVFPIMRDGHLLGAIEKWEMSGCVEIRGIDLEDPSALGEVLQAIDDMMRFYRMAGWDIVRIREVMGVDTADLAEEVSSLLVKRGYHQINGFYAKGELVPVTFDQGDLLGYVIRKQRIPRPLRRRSFARALVARGGFRSDLEVGLRVSERTSLKEQAERGFMMRMQAIPDYLTYVSREHAWLYRAAKGLEIDEDMRLVIKVVKDHQPISKSRVMDLSPLGRARTQAAVRALQRGGALGYDLGNRLTLIPLREMDTWEARKRVVRLLFDNYGTFSAENLARFMKHVMPMRDVRSILASLEDEGVLVKGFLDRGEDTVHWMLAEDLDSVEGRVEEEFVLTHMDNLHFYLRPIIKRRFEAATTSVIFKGTEIVGGFKGRARGKAISVEEFQGGVEARRILREFLRGMGLSGDDPAEPPAEDWEIMDFYERTHPGEA